MLNILFSHNGFIYQSFCTIFHPSIMLYEHDKGQFCTTESAFLKKIAHFIVQIMYLCSVKYISSWNSL